MSQKERKRKRERKNNLDLLRLEEKTQTVVVHTTVVRHTGQLVGAMLDESLDGKLRDATETETSNTAKQRTRGKLAERKRGGKTYRVEPEGMSFVASSAEGKILLEEKHRICTE